MLQQPFTEIAIELVRETADRYTTRGSVGKELQDERKRQGQRLDQLCEVLRIRPRYLAALEQGRYDHLPGRSFAIGYAGRYARYLGLDVDKLSARLEAEIDAHGGIRDRHVHVEPVAEDDRKACDYGVSPSFFDAVWRILRSPWRQKI